MKKQQALNIEYAKSTGTLALDQLNDFLAQGWTVATTEVSGGGNILVIVEKEINQDAPA